jgi:hypothetical protein
MIKKLLFAGLVGVSTTIQAEPKKIEIDEPKFEAIKSPEYSANTKPKKWDQKEWLEMEVKFKVTNLIMRKLPKDKTLPKLTVKWFVVAEDPNKSDKYIRMTKEVVHVNIPIEEEMYTSCYISPSGVRRLSGGREKASEKMIFGVGGEFYLDGELIGFFASKDDKVKVNGKNMPFWYAPTLSESQSVQIHDKNETPFELLWIDKFAEVESEKNKAAPPEAGN